MGLRVALSLKLAQGKLRIIDSARIEEPKTKQLLERLHAQGWPSRKTLVIGGAHLDKSLSMASSNIHWLKLLPKKGCNVYDILNHDTLVLSLEALQYLEERLVDAAAPQFFEFKTLEQQQQQ